MDKYRHRRRPRRQHGVKPPGPVRQNTADDFLGTARRYPGHTRKAKTFGSAVLGVKRPPRPLPKHACVRGRIVSLIRGRCFVAFAKICALSRLLPAYSRLSTFDILKQ